MKTFLVFKVFTTQNPVNFIWFLLLMKRNITVHLETVVVCISYKLAITVLKTLTN